MASVWRLDSKITNKVKSSCCKFVFIIDVRGLFSFYVWVAACELEEKSV